MVDAAGIDRHDPVVGVDPAPADDGRHLEVARGSRLLLHGAGEGGAVGLVVPAPHGLRRVGGQIERSRHAASTTRGCDGIGAASSFDSSR